MLYTLVAFNNKINGKNSDQEGLGVAGSDPNSLNIEKNVFFSFVKLFEIGKTWTGLIVMYCRVLVSLRAIDLKNQEGPMVPRQ